MSIDLHIHLGPYFRCEKQKITKMETKLGCSKCKKNIATEFCSTCGTARDYFEIEFLKDKACTGDLIEKMEDRLYVLRDEGRVLDDRFDFYVPNFDIPNIKRKFDPIDDPSRDNECIHSGLVLGEMKEFITFFEKELLMLEEAYDGKVLVQWGFLHCYN